MYLSNYKRKEGLNYAPFFIMTSEEKIQELLSELFVDSEYFLVDIVTNGKRIEVYIDGDANIKIDKCVEVSRYLEESLETGGFVGENYLLEVSSPGMTNPIKVMRQYRKYVGRQLEILLEDGTRKDGELKAVDDNKLTLEVAVKIGKKKKDIELRLVDVLLEDIKVAKRKITF